MSLPVSDLNCQQPVWSIKASWSRPHSVRLQFRSILHDIKTHQNNQEKGEQKQKAALEKQKLNNKEKKTQRERYIGKNQLQAPISRTQSKRIKKELLVPIGNNQD